MKVRHLKHRIMALMGFRFMLDAQLAALMKKYNEPTAAEKAKHKAANDKFAEDLLAAITPQKVAPATMYTVARKKDGVVVGEYSTRAEADDVVERAKKQKKAALEIVST